MQIKYIQDCLGQTRSLPWDSRNGYPNLFNSHSLVDLGILALTNRQVNGTQLPFPPWLNLHGIKFDQNGAIHLTVLFFGSVSQETINRL